MASHAPACSKIVLRSVILLHTSIHTIICGSITSSSRSSNTPLGTVGRSLLRRMAQSRRASSFKTAALDRFSRSFYCSGAIKRQVLLPNRSRAPSGKAYWTSTTDVWDPAATEKAATHHFLAREAAHCLQDLRVLFVGDSTARHCFYTYTALAGQPVVPTMQWKEGAFEPVHQRYTKLESEMLATELSLL